MYTGVYTGVYTGMMTPKEIRVLRELLQMAETTHVHDNCTCMLLFKEAKKILRAEGNDMRKLLRWIE